MSKIEKLVDRYNFGARYIADDQDFRAAVLNKSVIPYQVEFQPPPRSLRKICWLECPYCYGLSADDSEGDRLDKDRAISIMQQIADGGVKKGYLCGLCDGSAELPIFRRPAGNCY